MGNLMVRGLVAILRLLLRIVCFVLTLILTVIYFIIGTAGSILTVIGYFSGTIIGIITIIFWIFGEYNTWQQVVESFGLAAGLFLVPMGLTKYGSLGILWLMGRLGDLGRWQQENR